MKSEKLPLKNNLIEGFLFLYLTEPKTMEEIIQGILDRYGPDMCKPEWMTDTNEPKFHQKVKNIVAMGVKNKIYSYNPSTKTYKIT